MGSVSLSRVRLGSALEMTALALISSPVESSTPVAAPSLHANLDDFGCGANLDAGGFRGGRHGLRERAHSACGEEGRACGMRIAGRANQQLQGASGRPWSEKSSEDSASGDDGAQ